MSLLQPVIKMCSPHWPMGLKIPKNFIETRPILKVMVKAGFPFFH